jgi:hypothetical protein
MRILEIQRVVASYYGIPLKMIVSPNREYRYSHPRQVAMSLARELTDASLPLIGHHFGGRDHATVVHAIKAVQRRAENKHDVEAIKELLKASAEERGEAFSEMAASRQAERQFKTASKRTFITPIPYAGYAPGELRSKPTLVLHAVPERAADSRQGGGG